MPPIGWIDFSSEHREKMRAAIDCLSTPGAVDELGIGIIRDAFADTLFPGVSTIQTRPKYFIRTARLLEQYRQEQGNHRRKKSLEQFLEDEELLDRIRLVEAHGAESDSIGIIGGSFGTRKDRNVVRRPSSVYWNGLREFGIVQPAKLSLAEFGRRLSDNHKNLHTLLNDTSTECGDDLDAMDHTQTIRVSLPPGIEETREQLTIELTDDEAVFLKNKIISHQPGSLLGKILIDDHAIAEIIDLPKSPKFADLAALTSIGELEDTQLCRTVAHALKFWQLMFGAHIRYNCMLQELSGTKEKKEEFEAEWDLWRENLPNYLEDWDTDFMWAIVTAKGRKARPQTRTFIESWITQCQDSASDLVECERLVKQQERANKGKRARLTKNEGAINDWVGFNELEYRFPQVRRILIDIHTATEGQHA
jgi:hypothetical protein